MSQKSLRLWPGVLIVLVQWPLRFLLPQLWPDAIAVAVFGGLLGWVAVVVWWAFFSRAPKRRRWSAIIIMILAMFVTRFFLHESIALGGMGMMYFIFVAPVLSLFFVAWAMLSRKWPERVKCVTMIVAIFAACGLWLFLRTGGLDASFNNELSWRWSPSPEEKLLARSDGQAGVAPDSLSLADARPQWPGFRGPQRDGIVRGIAIDTNWVRTPPRELWRHPVGPGWSSFAVQGDCIFTQEQRGEEEAVSCYRLKTGELVWMHLDSARFWESNGGAGPRATPLLFQGRVYALGGTGILNALDAATGQVIWSRNAAEDTDTKTPIWGFSGSPLVVDDLLVVPVSGALVAYDLDAGDIRWQGPKGGEGYASPHVTTLHGVEQILFVHGGGLVSVAPADGSILWEHAWKGYPIVQPTCLPGGDVLVSVDERTGIRRLHVTRTNGEWGVEEKWTSDGVKPYFNDSVVYDGFVYGFNSRRLACVHLKEGTRMWKDGRYGNGQCLLLADQGLLLILSERGDLALVKAHPHGFQEVAKVPAIQGKTWNHPVLTGEVLLVRNAQEMAAFQLLEVSE